MTKSLMLFAVATMFAATVGGCGYAGVATAGTAGDAVVIARNDWFLFGALRKVYVCKVTPVGLTQCANSETP